MFFFSLFTEKTEQQRDKEKKKKDTCPFCKEQKKRPLVAYMRKREVNKRTESICEEEEEVENENQEKEQKKWLKSSKNYFFV